MRKKSTITIATSLVLVALISAYFVLPSSVHASVNNFFRNSITHQPETLTELYFANPATVPETYTPGEPAQTSFTINNLEGKGITYRYRIYLVADGVSEAEQRKMAEAAPVSTVAIPDQASRTLAVSAATDLSGPRVQLVIELVDQQQAIHLWLQRAPS